MPLVIEQGMGEEDEQAQPMPHGRRVDPFARRRSTTTIVIEVFDY